MKDLLSISLFQYNIAWENPQENIKMLDQWLPKIPGETDLVLLPEMFITGFSMNAKSAQKMGGIGVEWLKSASCEYQVTIGGSLAIEEEGKYFNRFIIAQPNGTIDWYDKRHLFRMGEEHETYSSGEKQLIIDIKGWKVMPLVCYDLRFPVWSRNIHQMYDLLIYVANWPEPRHDAFVSLLKARAIENQSYVVAVNRVGTDGHKINYAGGSGVFDPKGKLLVSSSNEEIINCTISLTEQRKFREKFPAHLDADNFNITDLS